MQEVAGEGRTVLFVSHNMAAVQNLCNTAILLEQGKVASYGEVKDIVAQYILSGSHQEGEHIWTEGIANTGVSDLKVLAVRIKDNHGAIANTLDMQTPFSVEIEYQVFNPLPLCRVGIVVSTTDGTIVLQSYDADWNHNGDGARDVGLYTSRCVIPGNLLSPGRFTLSVMVNVGLLYLDDSLAWLENVLTFEVEATRPDVRFYTRLAGVVSPDLDWQRIAH